MRNKRNAYLSLIGIGLMLLSLLVAGCGDSSTSARSTSSNPSPASTAAGANPIAPATTAIPGAVTTQPGSSATNQPPVKVAVGYTAPDFTAKDINGQTIQLSSLRGKAILINFWAVY